MNKCYNDSQFIKVTIESESQIPYLYHEVYRNCRKPLGREGGLKGE